MAGPLDGVRVVDLSAMASGPLATALLAEASVVTRTRTTAELAA